MNSTQLLNYLEDKPGFIPIQQILKNNKCIYLVVNCPKGNTNLVEVKPSKPISNLPAIDIVDMPISQDELRINNLQQFITTEMSRCNQNYKFLQSEINKLSTLQTKSITHESNQIPN
jgi:hypothetical protein